MVPKQYKCTWCHCIVHLKMVKMANVMFCVLYHDKKMAGHEVKRGGYPCDADKR